MSTLNDLRRQRFLDLWLGRTSGEPICLDYASLAERAHWDSEGFAARSRRALFPRDLCTIEYLREESASGGKVIGCKILYDLGSYEGGPVYRCSDCGRNEPDCPYKSQPETKPAENP